MSQTPGKPTPEGSQRSGVRYAEVSEDQDGQRIDNFLLAALKTVPRSLVYRLLRTGQVRVNKGRVKPSHKLSSGDSVRIPPVTVPEQKQVRVPRTVIQSLQNAIVADEEHWIVLNKPAGIAAHGGTGLSFGVIDGIREIFSDSSIGLVHRLDKSTSGVMVLAKSRKASVHFQQALIDGKVEKKYVALLGGVLKKPREVNARLRKTHPTDRENLVIIDPQNGKEAHSRFSCRVAGKRITFADVEIETGRTHQIRVHAASIKHAVVGDDRYGDEKLNQSIRQLGAKGMFLHAHEIAFPELQSADSTAEVLRRFTVSFDPRWLDVVTW